MTKLDHLREQIDDIDAHIVELLKQRADVVLQVKAEKSRDHIDIYSPIREQQILERAAALAEGGSFPPESIGKVFGAIVSATRSLIGELSVSYVGAQYAPCHQAAVQHFGNDAKFTPSAAVDAVFAEVEGGTAHLGVVPIEAGVPEVEAAVLEAFVRSKLSVIGEIVLRDHSRFFVIAPRALEPSEKDKTSLLCIVQDKAGALRDLLNPIAEQGVTLMRIESHRWSGGNWEHAFLLDLAGHVNSEPVRLAAQGVEKLCSFFRVLGSYPEGVSAIG
jgi:chorismate mutase